MKELLFLRHGESSAYSESDIKRPLTHFGVTQLSKMALKLKQINWIPDIVFCSTAKRTQETQFHLLKNLNISPLTYNIENFYLGGINDVVEILLRFAPKGDRVLLIGHNNGWSDAVNLISRSNVILAPAEGALLNHHGDQWQNIFSTLSGWALKTVLTP